MQRRPSIVLATRVELEAAFETGEAAAVEVVFDALPWIERIPSSQVDVAEDHAAEMRQVGEQITALEEQYRASNYQQTDRVVFCHESLGTPLDPSKLTGYARKAFARTKITTKRIVKHSPVVSSMA